MMNYLNEASAGVSNVKGFGQHLQIQDGEAIDKMLIPLLAAVRTMNLNEVSTLGLASSGRGRMQTIFIPSGTYTMSSTTATITVETWMRLKTMGNVRIGAGGHAAPVFWVRNDITAVYAGAATTQVGQGSDCENNNAYWMDAGNGVLLIEGNKSTNSVGVRYGNGDGVMGTAYVSGAPFHTALVADRSIHITGMEAALEYTNNNGFCHHHENMRVTNNKYGWRSSTAAVNENAMEQSRFLNCFFNGQDLANFQFNGGSSTTSSSGAHQLLFIGGSVTYGEGDNVQFNTTAKCRMEFMGGRIENGDSVCRATVSSPRSWVILTSVNLIPTKASVSKPPHLRKLFIGAGGSHDYNVKMTNITIDLSGSNQWSDTVMNSAANLYLADESVWVQYSNISCSDPAGTIADNNSMRYQPVVNKSAALNRNAFFEEATLIGWTAGGTGTNTRDTSVFYDGTASFKMVCANQVSSIVSDEIKVEAGRAYFGTCTMNVVSSGGTSFVYLLPEVVWYAANGDILRTDTVIQNSTFLNAHNRRNDGWVLHPTGTGLLFAPAGAEKCRVGYYLTAGSTNKTTNCTATVHIDAAPFVAL
jgi:hypothetical protein